MKILMKILIEILIEKYNENINWNINWKVQWIIDWNEISNIIIESENNEYLNILKLSTYLLFEETQEMLDLETLLLIKNRIINEKSLKEYYEYAFKEINEIKKRLN